MLGRHLGRMARRRDQKPDDGMPASPSLESPEVRAYLTNAYRKAVEQEVSFLAVFTGDRDFLYNYRNQMLDALNGVQFGNRLQLEFFAGCDHTFCSESERGRLVRLVADWIQRQAFKATPAGYEELGQNQLANEVFASPVIAGSRIYHRAAVGDGDQRQEGLYCLGE